MKLEFWVPGITIGASKPQMCSTHIKRKEKSERIKIVCEYKILIKDN